MTVVKLILDLYDSPVPFLTKVLAHVRKTWHLQHLGAFGGCKGWNVLHLDDADWQAECKRVALLI